MTLRPILNEGGTGLNYECRQYGDCERLTNVENDWDGEEDSVPSEGPWDKVTEKLVLEAFLKRMTKDKASGPSKESCEMFLNDVCVRELC